MSNRWAIAGAAFIVATMVAACIVATLKIDLTPKAEKGRSVQRERNFGEGIRLSQHGLYGIDLVSIGKAHMRKLRKGPFTIGAINELVLEDVSLVLPEDMWRGTDEVEKKGGGEGGGRNGPSDTGPRAMLGKLGINAGNLKLGGKMPRFSALAVRRLRVARLEGTNAVPWFAAECAEAKRDGLKLARGWTVENGRTNGWSEAVLVIEPTLRLVPTS